METQKYRLDYIQMPEVLLNNVKAPEFDVLINNIV
jgi:hypothetical protein